MGRGRRRGPTPEEVRQREARGWHRDATAALVERALEVASQHRPRAGVPEVECAVAELGALQAVFLVHAHRWGLLDNPKAMQQARDIASGLMQRATGEAVEVRLEGEEAP